MNHAKNIMYLLLCTSSIIVSMNQSDWQLLGAIPHTSKINSAYFDNNGKLFGNKTLIATVDASRMHIYDANSGKQQKTINHLGDILCIDSTGYLLTFTHHQERTAYYPCLASKGPQLKGGFNSNIAIAPHRFSFHKSDTTAGTVARVIGSKWIGIYDMNDKKDTCFFAHENPIKDCCFHPFKNILASITAPDTWIRIIDVLTRKTMLTLPSYKTYYTSIRFDETGNRLALTNEKTIDVLDISDLNHPQTIFSVQNTLNGTQACLNDKYLAVAFPAFITLFNVETQQAIAQFAGNNDASPMNCFDATGNFMVILNGNNAFVYKKTVIPNRMPVALTSLEDTTINESDLDCCCTPIVCTEEIKRTLSSIVVFLKSQLS